MPGATVTLVSGMQFVGESDSGHAVVMDGDVNHGGKNMAARPTELLLMALGGCTGMDVISILRKKRQKVSSFSMRVTGDREEGHPGKFVAIQIEYIVTGTKVSPQAVERAIDLSVDKYCSVGATLAGSARITHTYRIVEEGEEDARASA